MVASTRRGGLAWVGGDPSVGLRPFLVRRRSVLREEGDEAHVEGVGLLYRASGCVRLFAKRF